MKQPRRYRCPNGHTYWRRRSDEFECETCGLRFREDDLVDVVETDDLALEFAHRSE